MTSSKNVRAGFAILAAALSCLSYAGAPKPTPTPPAAAPIEVSSTSVSGAIAGAEANAAAASRSRSDASSASTAAGGTATAAGGAGGAGGQGGAGGSSDASGEALANGEVNVSSDDDVYIPRQLPPIIQAMLIRTGCGAGFGIGGGDTNEQGAVQAVFTSDQCYALQSIGLSIAMGDYRGACERLAYVNRDADRKMGYKPDCATIAATLENEAKAAGKAAQTADDTGLGARLDAIEKRQGDEEQRNQRRFEKSVGK